MPTGISYTVTLGGRKTSILGDHVNKCQQGFLVPLPGKA
jgi:hypothetical protein